MLQKKLSLTSGSDTDQPEGPAPDALSRSQGMPFPFQVKSPSMLGPSCAEAHSGKDSPRDFFQGPSTRELQLARIFLTRSMFMDTRILNDRAACHKHVAADCRVRKKPKRHWLSWAHAEAPLFQSVVCIWSYTGMRSPSSTKDLTVPV